MSQMSKGERDDLQRLIRQREKVQKSSAKLTVTEFVEQEAGISATMPQPEGSAEE